MSLALCACDDNSSDSPVTPPASETPKTNETPKTELPPDSQAQCGNDKAEGNEVCDGSDKVPTTCAQWDPTKVWADGGAPKCSSKCDAIEQGTCHEIRCGDDEAEGNEVCDGSDQVPATCAQWDPTKVWADGGAPKCSQNCDAIEQGTCTLAPRELNVMNWNVLFEYVDWGGSEVLPRARILHDILAGYEKKPDFISMVEASKAWHADDVNALLADLGYAWAETSQGDPNSDSGYYMTQVIYQKDRFEVLEHDSVTLYPYTAAGDARNKCISFASVMREKDTGVEFIIMSTHWDPNIESNTCTYKKNLTGPIIMREQNRVRGAAQTVELIDKMRTKYPKAHVFYGGDINTIDFQLIFDSPETSKILGSDMAALIKNANTFYTNAADEPCGKPFPEDFVGSFDTFVRDSGLLSARDQANATGKAINDVSSINKVGTEGSAMGDFLQDLIESLLNMRLIIDYAFYSPEMTLIEYEVMTDKEYEKISDHFPIRTKYTYYLE